MSLLTFADRYREWFTMSCSYSSEKNIEIHGFCWVSQVSQIRRALPRNAAYFSKFVRAWPLSVTSLGSYCFKMVQVLSCAIHLLMHCIPSLGLLLCSHTHTCIQCSKFFGATRWVNSNITYLYISQNTFFTSSRTSNEQNATGLHPQFVCIPSASWVES